MSMNIMIEATREVQVVKTGKIREQRIHYEAWETPTEATREILNSAEPAKTYKEQVLRDTLIWNEGIFAEDDIFCEGEPIGTRSVNPGEVEVEEFDKWLAMCEEEGFTVEFHMM